MNGFWHGCFCFLAALTLFAAERGPRASTNRAAAAVSTTNDSVAVEFQRLLDADNEAQAEIDDWIKENYAFAARDAGVPREELNQRIFKRLDPIRKGYQDFIKRFPTHTGARVAYGSFLSDLHEEEAAQEQLEKALELNAKDPAVYNNLANIYGHIGPSVKKAFEYYAKAIELKPDEPVYYHNFGTTVFLFRKDAQEYYGISEQEVFDKALELYSKAIKLDPTNFPLASDIAQTYYGIRPPRTEDSLIAWTNAYKITNDGMEREGVHLHFARIKMHAGRLDEAKEHLQSVTNAMYADLKRRLSRNLAEREEQSKTNKAPAKSTIGQGASPNP